MNTEISKKKEENFNFWPYSAGIWCFVVLWEDFAGVGWVHLQTSTKLL